MKLFATCLFSLVAAGALSATTVPTVVTADVVNFGSKLLDHNGDQVGLYTINVNGTNYATLCVDYQDYAQIGNSYSAYETQVSSGNFSKTYNSGSATQYKEEAYLMSLILQPNSDRVDIQDAAWAITDSNYKAGNVAQQYVSLAVANYNTIDLSKFDIISDTNVYCGRTQEFLIDPSANAPEPGTMLLMGGGLLVAGLARRKMVKKA